MRKRFLSIILTLALCLSMLPALSLTVQASDSVIYTQNNGTNASGGTGTQSSPYNMLEDALNAVSENGTIIVLEKAYVNDTSSTDSPLYIDKSITIKGSGDGAYIDIRSGSVVLGGDVTFQDIQLSTANVAFAGLFANGHSLTMIGTTKGTNLSRPLNIYGGGYYSNNVWVGDTPGTAAQISISGSSAVDDVYAGSLGGDYGSPVAISIDGITGDSIGTIYGTNGDDSAMTGAVTVTLANSGARTVTGATSGTVNVNVTTSNQYTPSITNVSSVTAVSGVLKPSALDGVARLGVGVDGILDLSAVMDNNSNALTVSAFAGEGGKLRMGNDDKLTIADALSGTAEFQTTNNQPTDGSTSGIVISDHVYIDASAATRAAGYIIDFIPCEIQSTMVLAENSGVWTAQTEDSTAPVITVSTPIVSNNSVAFNVTSDEDVNWYVYVVKDENTDEMTEYDIEDNIVNTIYTAYADYDTGELVPTRLNTQQTGAGTEIYYLSDFVFGSKTIVLTGLESGMTYSYLLVASNRVLLDSYHAGSGSGTDTYTFKAFTTINKAAEDEHNGYYCISTADTLLEFASMVNSGETDIKGVLMTDIDMSDTTFTPVGTAENKFGGIFDGDGYAITGFNMSVTRKNACGLFAYVDGGTVKNLTLSGEVTAIFAEDSGSNFEYGVVGNASNDAVFENIHSTVSLTLSQDDTSTKTNDIDRIAGIVGAVSTGKVTVERCSFGGTINLCNSGAYTTGGIAGYIIEGSASTVRDCSFYGTITTGYDGARQVGGIVAYHNGANLTFKNNLSVGVITTPNDTTEKASLIGVLKNHTNSGELVTNNYISADSIVPYGTYSDDAYYLSDEEAGQTYTAATENQLANGEIAYKLGTAWGQAIGTDQYPVIGGMKIYQYSDMYLNAPDRFEIHSYDAEDKTAIVCMPESGTYAIVFVDYEDGRLNNMEIKDITVTEASVVPVSIAANTVLGSGDKIMLWDGLSTLKPLCDAFVLPVAALYASDTGGYSGEEEQ